MIRADPAIGADRAFDMRVIFGVGFHQQQERDERAVRALHAEAPRMTHA